MQIYLARNNQQAGPYTVEQINQMLASQQVLLTDLAWYQGMPEWKALGEITQGKLVFEPSGSQQNINLSPSDNILNKNNSNADQNPTIRHIDENKKTKPELASIGSRIFAKILDLLLWLPSSYILVGFFNEKEKERFLELNNQYVNNLFDQTPNPQLATQILDEMTKIFSPEAIISTLLYILVMLGVQAFLLNKYGQSIGKKILKIQIVDVNNNSKVSLMRVFTLRSFIFIIFNMFTPIISMVDSLFAIGKKKQALHDKLVKTKVIKKLD